MTDAFRYNVSIMLKIMPAESNYHILGTKTRHYQDMHVHYYCSDYDKHIIVAH